MNLKTASTRVVRGVRTDEYGALAWAPSGEWLFVVSRRGWLIAHDASTGRTVKLPERVRGNVHSIAAG